MTRRVVAFIVLILASAAPIALAAPPRQGPGEEPTKPPYVFPTPIFIPTFPGDTPAAKATAAPRPTSDATLSSEGTYTVQSGDSPWTIAQKLCGNGTKSSLIMSANNIGDSTRVRVGTVLKIPPECSGATPVPTLAVVATPELSSPPAPTLVESPTPTRTPTPIASVSTTDSVFGLAVAAMNIASGLLFLGSVFSGVSAYMVYRRKQFLEQMTRMTRRLLIRK